MESGDPEVWAEEVEFFLDCCERQENTLEDEPCDIVRRLLNLFSMVLRPCSAGSGYPSTNSYWPICSMRMRLNASFSTCLRK